MKNRTIFVQSGAIPMNPIGTDVLKKLASYHSEIDPVGDLISIDDSTMKEMLKRPDSILETDRLVLFLEEKCIDAMASLLKIAPRFLRLAVDTKLPNVFLMWKEKNEYFLAMAMQSETGEVEMIQIISRKRIMPGGILS